MQVSSASSASGHAFSQMREAPKCSAIWQAGPLAQMPQGCCSFPRQWPGHVRPHQVPGHWRPPLWPGATAGPMSCPCSSERANLMVYTVAHPAPVAGHVCKSVRRSSSGAAQWMPPPLARRPPAAARWPPVSTYDLKAPFTSSGGRSVKSTCRV